MASQPTETVETTCCIAGGGPAGIMLGFLLARAGIEVLILEKHRDFLRDFRGDTLHPSTLELMRQLGLLESLLGQPHQQIPQVGADLSGAFYPVADFFRLKTKAPFIALMPQWDFLNFMAEQGRRYPAFHLRMEAEVTDLMEEAGTITGVRARHQGARLEVRARLVIGADGRRSTVRERSGLEVIDFGAPIDVLWFRLSKNPDDPERSLGYIGMGRFMVMINRGDYWQCGFLIPKGQFAANRRGEISSLQADVVALAPFLHDRIGRLNTWDAVSLLTVKIDRLVRWYRVGLLCIGDSAHAMSPVGGVGINLAIQDAVAAANLLYQPLRDGTLQASDLEKVQQRRDLPTRITQRIQTFLHDHFLGRVFRRVEPVRPPLLLRLARVFPPLRTFVAYLIGIGIRPERIETPEAGKG